MDRVRRTQILPYTQAQMFELVADVERYPEFIRWCNSVQLFSKDEGATEAKIGVHLGPFAGAFSARAELHPNEAIRLRLVEGLFSSFEGDWSFEPCAEGTRVTLDLRFQFGRGVGLVLEMLFRKAADKLVSAFEERAEQLYGRTGLREPA